MKLRTLNVRSKGNQAQARQYGVRVTPMTVILRPDGGVYTRAPGVIDEASLVSYLEGAKG